MPKFPSVRVPLAGMDGNVFSIMGRVARAMRDAGCTEEDVDAYLVDARSGNYDHALQVTMATVETCSDEDDEEDDWDDWDDDDDDWNDNDR